MNLQRLIDHAWVNAHARWGRPTMTIVHPVSLWNLPAGYSLDAATGNIRNAAGDVLANPAAYVSSTTVGLVPAKAQHSGTGIMPADSTPDDVVRVRIRYSDLAVVRAAQYVEYGGEKYDVVDDARMGHPANSRLTVVVTLHRRRDNQRSTWSQWDRRWNGQ